MVGPSGSGKSSLVRAGLLPELRAGALPGSDTWFDVPMQVGARPFAMLEAALVGVAVHPPSDLSARLRTGPGGLCEIVRQLLPPDSGDELVLIIDQFEELFTLVNDQAEIEAFMSGLAVAVSDPDCRLSVILTLRADFFDRPLRHTTFGALMRERTEVGGAPVAR